ncbi:MAG TPA: sigma-70 family RNA polymerase sigma factor, partial [Pirellulaceae bacterium]|nr:sigma-70 family RNA polymerase sigma factor [Pirellulaceae bacterium]
QFERWLRTILAGTLANTTRHYLGTQARNAQLEQEILVRFDQSTCGLSQMLIDPRSSPSQQVARAEMGGIVAHALGQLSPDYQQVLTMRHLESMTFPEIAQRMARSVDSVEKLWLRGITKLRRLFAEHLS